MENFKPTNRKPLGKMSKKMEKNYDMQLKKGGIKLTEVDNILNEKEQSFKKKIWDLAKMESLVHSDPKLSAKYAEMSEDGEEKYGYHYNETIMNILFNDYVMNSQQYLEKYKNSIPAKKKRRDKSGINQLQQKGEEKMDNKSSKKNEDVVTHNNSLEGVIEELEDNYNRRSGEGTFDDREYITKSIERQYDTMEEPIQNETTGAASSGAFAPALGHSNKKFVENMNENMQPAPIEVVQQAAQATCDAVKLDTGKDCQVHDVEEGSFELSLGGEQYAGGSYTVDSDGQITLVSIPNPIVIGNVNNSPEELVKGFEPIHGIDETTTSASSGQYSSPYAWAKGKSRHSKKPAYDGGEIVGESYLINSNYFKEFIEKINEGMNSPNDDSRVPIAEYGDVRTVDSATLKTLFNNIMQNIRTSTGGDKNLAQDIRSELIRRGEMKDDSLTKLDLTKVDSQMLKKSLASYMTNLKSPKDEPNANAIHQELVRRGEMKDFNPSGGGNIIKKVGSWLGLGEGEMIGEHHLHSKEDKIEFILANANGKFGDADMLNAVDDEVIEKIYREVEYDMGVGEAQLNTPDLNVPELNEKSKSKAQQKFMGQVYAYKKGELDDASDAIKKAADSMSMEDAEDFASTKHKGLPEKVDEDNYQRKFVSYSEVQNLANMLDNAPVEEEEEIVNDFIQSRELSLGELKNQVQNHIKSKLAGSESPEYFKFENVITIVNDMLDQSVEGRRQAEKDQAMRDYYRTPAGKAELETQQAAQELEEPIGESIDEDWSNGVVQYDSERSGEEPFEIDGNKWQYVNAIYPDGKKDIGVYRFGHDLVYDINWFKENILGDKVNENPVVGALARGAGAAIAGRMMESDGQVVNDIAGMLQKVFPDHSNAIDGFTKLAHDTVRIFFQGDYNKAYNAIKGKMGDLMGDIKGEGIISNDRETMSMDGNNPTTMAATMKDVAPSGGLGEGVKIDKDKKITTPTDKNELKDFGTSNEGNGGFNGKGDGNHPNYKNPPHYGAPTEKDTKETVTKMNEDAPFGICETHGQPLNEDGHCRKDEVPVAGKIAGQKGSCKKKKTQDTKADDNKFNVKLRKKREKEMSDKREKSRDEYTKELEKNKKQMKKLKEMVEGINEDKRPSALVQMDRLHKDNEKNFDADMKDSNTADIKIMQDELKAEDQIEEVPENAYELAEKIEKDKMKQHEFKSFDNVGNSTNDNNKEIPKRNFTDPEAEDLMKDRGLGMQDIVYDNKPDERFEERMKKDMGETIYDQRQEKMKHRSEAPMYNKDTQPTDDDSVEKDQFEKNINKYNSRRGVKEDKQVTGRIVNDLNKSEMVNFNINEAVEVEKVSDGSIKINLTGMGNRYTQDVNEDTGMRGLMDQFDFYFNNGSVEMVKKSKQTLTESANTGKGKINADLQKMLKLSGYDPSKYVDTSSVKKNRGF